MTSDRLTASSRIGIVNRGEPAVRAIRAIREYNESHGTMLQSIALFLAEEADAVFVREADFAIPLTSVPGAPIDGRAYLDHEVLLAALTLGQCDAVWPGWGFVSEDATFVEKIEAAGLLFLGPDSKSMALLGDKIAAKELAESSGVPILPWSKRAIRDIDDAAAIAEQIGYPVIVKAAHAGGGRGIRFVMTPEQLEAQLTSAVEETKRITGDEIVFIERLVVTGRHLEVQCLSDTHGNVATFGVRDCSVQRRNQKIIEETPPPVLDPEIAAEAEAAAARLLEAAKYRSAGTVEFLYDVDRNEFYFMEVNTRLQVEHPITEVRYGVDLIGGQIDIGFGKSVPVAGPPREVVIEARLNAEDPEREFAPAPGLVRFVRMPAGPGVRVDSGIEQGSTIPSLFDSMVAKIIASGPDRTSAIARLRRALSETRIHIDGGTTNKAFLLELLRTKELVTGGVHTKWVEAYLGERVVAASRARPDVALLAAAMRAYRLRETEEQALFRRQIEILGYPRSVAPSGATSVTLSYDGNTYQFATQRIGHTSFLVESEDASVLVDYRERGSELRLILGDERFSIQMIPRGDQLQCEVDGIPYAIGLDAGGTVSAPSPAVVLAIRVSAGETVERGRPLLSLEAMKMEMIVEAPEAGVVREIAVVPGQQVAAGETLITIEGGEEAEAVDGGDPVLFVSSADPRTAFDEASDALRALFLGYDLATDPRSVVDRLIGHCGDGDEARRDVAQLFVEVLSAYTTIDTLFCNDRISADQFARTVTWQELIFVAFRYRMLQTDSLPPAFTQAFERATELYPRSEDEQPWDAFYHMYRAQRNGATKHEVLRSLLVTLEDMRIPNEMSEPIVRLLESVIRLNQLDNPAIADAALHARYHLHDRYVLIDKRRRRRARFAEKFKAVCAAAASRETDVSSLDMPLIDAGPHVVAELLARHAAGGDAERREALRLLAARMVRDRALESLRVESGVAIAIADGITTVLTVHDASDKPTVNEAWLEANAPARAADRELVVLSRVCDSDEAARLFATLGPRELPVQWLAVGAYEPDGSYHYRTFGASEEGWAEIEQRREFSPIFFRELRVSRLSRFTTNVLYHSDAVFLVHAVARENPRDERLFALAAAGQAEAEIDRQNEISRVSEFDEVYMEAVYKMRSEQARRPRRLLWNRIIVHIRALMSTTAGQIKSYGQLLVPLTKDLGVEKAVIYTRRKRWSEDVVRELELLFLNVSEDQFTLRSRKPSTEPLKPMDQYVSNVVRSRQRKNIYPYEIVRMVTYTGYPVSLEVPRGEFEEFDLDDEGQTTSVRGRPYGQNRSNVVFGLIRNNDPETEFAYQRVLILADPTRDLGSLAEPECRRVIAALDLAQQRGIPVEWIPISSGARIDMESGTENLDWTAAVLRRIIEFTQAGGEINVVVTGVNVGAQSYWNAEATMLMHARGLLLMTPEASMLLTGKRALDFSGSVSADSNVEIGGEERIMGPNGESQVAVSSLAEAYRVLLRHYAYTFRRGGESFVARMKTTDRCDRDVGESPYEDRLGQGFSRIADIFSVEHNPERKKPFDMRQVMTALIDADADAVERWAAMKDAETAITWETRLGGYGIGLIGIESRNLARVGDISPDGPEVFSGGTLFPRSSKKVARAINAWSDRVPTVVLANLSGFDGSPESLRRVQLEFGAEIGRAVVNFKGPLLFVVMARYHGGAYVVFSKTLNESLTVFALEGSFASVLGGAPAAAVVFPREVQKRTNADERVESGRRQLSAGELSQREFDDLYRTVHSEKQNQLASEFDRIHNIKRALRVGSIDEIISVADLRPRLIAQLEQAERAALR